MKVLSLDLETFSVVNLQKCGVYKYAESEDFEILLFGYAVDGGAVQVVDLACGESIPAEIIDALTDDSVIKTAYNATFERACLSRYLTDMGVSLDPFHDNHPLSQECAKFLNPASWHCTMIGAASMYRLKPRSMWLWILGLSVLIMMEMNIQSASAPKIMQEL